MTMNKSKVKETITGYLFIGPYLLVFMIFTGIPFIIALGLSFVNVKFITRLDNLKFIGLDNFSRFLKDAEGIAALERTIKYSALYVPMIMLSGLLLALLLNKGVHFKNTIRSMIFLPYVSNMVAVAVIFKVLLGPKGPLVRILMNLGLESPPILLLDTNLALPTVVAIAVWKSVGLNMIVYLAALQGVSAELLEAAKMDGATKWEQLLHVTLPTISPTTFFLAISSLITSLQNFTVIQSLTEGGPGQATTVMSIQIVRTAFAKFDTSYASAQAMIMFVFVMIITLVQWRGQKKWVNY